MLLNEHMLLRECYVEIMFHGTGTAVSLGGRTVNWRRQQKLFCTLGLCSVSGAP